MTSRAFLSVVMALALTASVPAASGQGGAGPSVIAAGAGPSLPAQSARATADGGRTPVVETSSLWRCFVVRGSELVRKEGGGLGHLYEFGPVKTKKVAGKRVTCLNEVQVPVHTPWPPAEWPSVDFDDSRWACAPGPFYVFTRDAYGLAGDYLSVVLVCLRRRFAVEDPSRIRDLRLSLEFEGGVVVYLNGEELARAHLPAGELKPDTPAEDYPKDAFVAPSGYLLRRRYGDPKKYPRRFEMRTRRIRDLAIPARMLRKGLNVLAIEIHRAPGHEAMFTGKTRRVHPRPGAWWNRLGLRSVSLTAAGVSGGIVGKARPTGLLVRNQPVISRVEPARPVDPHEPIRPVTIVGVRNGSFSGQIVVSDTRPIEGLRVAVSDLTGPGTIPSSAVRIRYMLRDGPPRRRRKPWFYGLECFPPKTVPVIDGAAVQPVWITVDVPADARPGEYRGSLTVSAEGAGPIRTPVELRVIDWALPDPREFKTHVGLIQSPETVAMKYGVELWSARHWKLLERSLALLGQLGNKVIYITMIRRSHFGNTHGMVSWVRQPDGSLKPDLSVAEKYIALAVKHLGKIPVVGIYCWEPRSSAAHFPSTSGRRNLSAGGDREILISVRAGADGELTEAVGPKWGTPECREFWTPAMDGLRRILRGHGIEKSMMLGIACDYIPTKACMDDLAAAARDAKWIVHSHTYWTNVRGRPVGYLAVVWGVAGVRDPALPKDYYGNRRYYGWRNPFLVTIYPRTGCFLELVRGKPLELYRFLAEGAIVAAGRPNAKPPGVRGFGRLGADFWPVIIAGRSRRGVARGLPSPICGRYREAPGGGMALAFTKHHILSPGRDGAIATDRFEMLREGLQEVEARIFIERALLDPAARARLGEALARRCQDLLDERVRTFLRAAGQRGSLAPDWLWYRGSSWQRRSARLYSAAAEVRKKLGGALPDTRHPTP